MRRSSIVMVGFLLCMTLWQTGEGSAQVRWVRETNKTVEFVPQSALIQSTAGAWVTVTLQSTGNVGFHTSIAVDSNDLVHISYSDGNNLMYTRQYRLGNDIWWATDTVAAADVESTSLALDENDRPYISYYDATDEDLCWVWSPTDGTWETGRRNTVSVDDGRFTSAAVHEGYMHIAYLNFTTKNVEYIKFVPGGAWPPTPETVDGADGAYGDISLALRSDGYPRISYYNDTTDQLMYARWTGSAWELDVLDGDVENKRGECNSLALDANNRARIAYFDATNRDLRHISYLLFGWDVPVTVDDSLGQICYVSLALDGSASSHILYYDGNVPGSLRYARRQGGADWLIETVDGPGSSCGMHSALALDSLGHPHASYYCAGDLMYAYRPFTIYLPVVMRGE